MGEKVKHITYLFSTPLLLSLMLVSTILAHPYRLLRSSQPIITVIGTGYVGLVTGACLAEFGNEVLCADINKDKIQTLNNNEIPFYEPGLKSLVTRNVEQKRLSFTHDVTDAIKQADIIFIAVGTPMSDNGAADLSAVQKVALSIAQHMDSFKVIVTKSTVPIGTGAWITQIMLEQGISADQFAVVSNPEFLREGSAINDFLFPDRIVVGTTSSEADDIMRHVYAYLLNQDIPYVSTNLETAELIKYGSNAFLATKISYINELAKVCDVAGADVQVVAHALGLDQRINKHFLNPGPGFGGSCFPKDTQALLYTAQRYGINIHTVQAALDANESQKEIPVQKLLSLMDNGVQNKTIAILGLAFKANTDDIRYSPAIATISKLLELGASIQAYDPQAMESMKQEFPFITYCASTQGAVRNADAVIIMTEWDDFKLMDIDQIGSLLKQRILVDARNIIEPALLHKYGFIFDNIGRSCLCTQKRA